MTGTEDLMVKCSHAGWVGRVPRSALTVGLCLFVSATASG
jgi:hypothetical protein